MSHVLGLSMRILVVFCVLCSAALAASFPPVQVCSAFHQTDFLMNVSDCPGGPVPTGPDGSTNPAIGRYMATGLVNIFEPGLAMFSSGFVDINNQPVDQTDLMDLPFLVQTGTLIICEFGVVSGACDQNLASDVIVFGAPPVQEFSNGLSIVTFNTRFTLIMHPAHLYRSHSLWAPRVEDRSSLYRKWSLRLVREY